jgi:hypothetical protein
MISCLAAHLQGQPVNNINLIEIGRAEGLSIFFCVQHNSFCCPWLSCEASCVSLQIDEQQL